MVVKNNVGILVLKDIMLNFWHQYILIGILSAFSFIFQMIGISIIISSFNGNFHLPLNLHNKLLNWFNDYQLVILSFFILSASTFLMFTGRKLTVSMMIKYESHCANKLFSIVSNNSKVEFNDAEIIRLLSKDCRFGGRIIQEISNIVMPVGVSIIAFPLLFYINYQATLVIMAIISLTFLPYSLIAFKANSISYFFEKSAGIDGQYKKQAISNFRKKRNPEESLSFPHDEFITYYKKRLIIPHYGILIGGIQIAFCLGVLGWWAVSSEQSATNIASIVFYGFVAVFTLNQLRTMAKVFANFHVFLAYFQRAFIIINDIDPAQIKNISNNDDSNTIMDEEDF